MISTNLPICIMEVRIISLYPHLFLHSLLYVYNSCKLWIFVSYQHCHLSQVKLCSTTICGQHQNVWYCQYLHFVLQHFVQLKGSLNWRLVFRWAKRPPLSLNVLKWTVYHVHILNVSLSCRQYSFWIDYKLLSDFYFRFVFLYIPWIRKHCIIKKSKVCINSFLQPKCDRYIEILY